MPLILFTNKKKSNVLTNIVDAILTTPANDSAAVKSYVTINNDVLTVNIINPAGLAISSIGASSGKLYFEFTQTAYYAVVGLSVTNPAANSARTWNSADLFGVYMHSGAYNCTYTGCGYGGGLGFALGDTLGVAMDLDTNTITWYKIRGTTVTIAGVSTSANCDRLGTMPKPWHPFCGSLTGSAAGKFNLYGPFKNLPVGYKAFSTLTPDKQPVDDFITDDVVDATVSTYVYSDNITPHGYNQEIEVNVTNCEYCIYRNSAWTAYSSSAGLIKPRETIRFRTLSSALQGGIVTATVTLGSLTKSFSVVTNLTTTSLLSITAHAPALSVGPNQLTVQASTVVGWASGRGDTVISSGKRYWEVSVNSVVNFGFIGIIDAASINIGLTNADVLGSKSYANKSAGLYVVKNNVTYGNETTGISNPDWTGKSVTAASSFTSNTDVLGFGLDMTTGQLRIFKNGVDQGVFISGITTPVFPAYSINTSNSAGLIFTFNFGAAGFKYLPAGYTPI